MVGLVASRDSWAQRFEGGQRLVNPLLEKYREERNGENWRSSKLLEEIFEYVLYLERNQSPLPLNNAQEAKVGCITNGAQCMNYESADLAEFATAMNKEMFRFIEKFQTKGGGSAPNEQVYSLGEWMSLFLEHSSFGIGGASEAPAQD